MQHTRRWKNGLIFLTCLLFASTLATSAQAQPSFSKSFAPSTIGPGAASRLTFTIDNAGGAGVTDLAFIDNLPASVILATPADPFSECGGTLTAPDGGSTITFVDGLVAPGASCEISVIVTSSTVGTHTNTTGDLTSSAGNSGTATADLEVDMDLPGFSKSFAPSAITSGSRSTLTFTIDNTANTGNLLNITFSDTFPSGMTVADPANASTTCTGGLLTAIPGTDNFSYGPVFSGDAALNAGATCTVQVDVVAVGSGTLGNISSELTAFNLSTFGTGSSGFAVANLDVSSGSLNLSKSFTDDPAAPGATVDLEFTIENRSRTDTATNVTFTDDLDATLSGLVATGLPANNVCGAGSQISGTSLLTLTGGSIPAGSSCTFSVTLQIPAAAAPGIYPNTTSTIGGDVGGSPVVGGEASDSLAVFEVPTLSKTFLADPVGAGATVSVEFTLTNTSSTSSATDISFSDDFSAFLAGSVPTSLPGAGFCGAGSINFVGTGTTEGTLFVQGANLAPSASCTFQIDLLIPVGAAAGTYTNTTSLVQATVGADTVLSPPATDTLTVFGGPTLSKAFTDDPVAAGATVTLEFTLEHDALALADATAIAFTDDLGATLSGLAATGLPLNDICGVGSQISGTTNLNFTGGTLTPGSSCTFSVTLQVPVAALPGDYLNITSNVISVASGETVVTPGGTDTLQISGLSFSKTFTDDPVVPGDTVTLEFTLDNTSTVDATGIFFTDSLSTTLSGLVATGLPMNDVCGTGSQISGTSFLIFTGGNLLAGTSCTFSVTLQVPAGAADGDYLNITSNLTATVGGGTAVLPPATDTLTVSSDQLLISKSFTDDPVNAGGTVTLEFTLNNLDATNAATAIAFTDNLDAVVSGLVATGTPIMDVCGVGSSLSGAGTLSLTGGQLPAGGSCTFSVTLQVPTGATPGTFLNTTSDVTGAIGGLSVTGDPATDDLTVQPASFSKNFAGPTAAGRIATLTFRLENLSPTDNLDDVAFTDDLDAVLPGLAAVGLPLMDVCSLSSQLTGTSLIELSNGSLMPASTCTIDVMVQVPATAAPGTYLNTSSDLRAGGFPIALPATASLIIEPAPTFAKAFAPTAIGEGQISTLTFTIDNTASSLTAGALTFIDNLPAGMTVATPANASTTCTGGTLTAVPGSSSITYAGGAVTPATTCTISVDITAATAGMFTNTSGDLTSDTGNSGPATADLTVYPQPAFSKAFAPATISVGGVSTLTFTIDNSAGTIALSALDFTDNLPAGVTLATPANGSTACGGTLTATDGASSVSFTGGMIGAGASCTVQADVTSSATGTYVNVSGALTSSIGTSTTATANLTVTATPTFSKAFAPNMIALGNVSTLTFTIDNTINVVDALSLSFTDNLPAGVSVATPANASTTCTGGTLTAVDGSGSISYTSGSAAAGATCTVQVDVTSSTIGVHVNTSGDLTSNLGNSGAAMATLTVNDAPAFSKAFAPASIVVGGTSTLTLTIDNTANVSDATALDFTDNLPAEITVASPANAATTCTGGTVTAVAGSGVVAYTGGSVATGASCTVQVDVTSSTVGVHLNTSGDLISSLGNSGPASASLTVDGAPLFAKAFAPTTIAIDGVSILTFTIDNTANPSDGDALDFTDNLPASVTVATPANASTTCTGGTLNASAGSTVISYTGGTVAAGATCTVAVDVTSDTAGDHANISSALTSTLGTSPAATATLTVAPPAIFTKSFAPTIIPVDGVTTLIFEIDNTASSLDATGIGFMDNLPADMLVADPANASTTCTGGTVTADPGTASVGYAGGTVTAGAICTVQVDVAVTSEGSFLNVTEDLTSSLGNSGPASATLIVQLGTLEIPTLGSWGMMLLSALLAFWGVRRLRRR